jgi:hypothetical protein
LRGTHVPVFALSGGGSIDIVAADGSIILVPPMGRDRETNLCPVTWYPQALK